MEADSELKGEGNSYDFGSRMYDPRIGRWFAEDPMAYAQPSSSPYSFANNNPVVLIDPDGELPILPLLIKAGAAGAADLMLQVAMSYYFDDDVESIGMAFDKVDYWQVSRSAAEGLIPWKVPGGKLGKAAATAVGDVLINATKAGVTGGEYSKSQALEDFTLGFLSDLAGGEIADLVKKYGGNKVRQVFKKMGLPDPCGCFTAGTKVYTESGNKNIEDIIVGDLVWAFDDKTEKIELKKVIRTFTKERDHIYRIYFGDNVIEATNDHPFFIGGKWLEVEQLKTGDYLSLYDGTEMAISKIEYEKGIFTVFNFEVENYHTYYVSKENVLVHNSGPCDWKPDSVSPSKMGDVDSFAKNTRKAKAIVGDKLTPDHIPSFAAVAKAVENATGKGLSRSQRNKIRRITTTLVIPESVHENFSQTFKGRNGKARVLKDAMNLRAAAESNFKALRPGLIKEGLTNKQIDAAFEAVRKQNEIIFKELGL